MVYGHYELMISKYCPIQKKYNVEKKNCNLCMKERHYLVDRMGFKFPIIKGEGCYTKILNCKKTYLLHNSVIDINIEFDKINKAPASNRKHFETAKEIAELVIKKYYFSNCADKKIINYIDEYLPSNYTKNKDINKVVWYFIVCVVTFNKQVVLSESAKGDD